MGLETKCTARVGGDTFTIQAHLNTDRLELRGELRLDVAFAAAKSIRVEKNGKLDITYAGGRVALHLANQATAEKWALKIRSPKVLIDKLGVKPESRVIVIEVNDADFSQQLGSRLVGGVAKPASSGL